MTSRYSAFGGTKEVDFLINIFRQKSKSLETTIIKYRSNSKSESSNRSNKSAAEWPKNAYHCA